MAFSKDRAIIAQNATGAAATIVAALLSKDDTVEDAVALFNTVRTDIFEGSLSLADGVIEGQTEAAPRRSSTSRSPRTTGSGGGRSDDAGAGVKLKFGKYAGRSIEDVYGEDAEYIEWLADTSNNEFIKGKAGEFLASVA
ncbi:MAG: exodeoxyribonuclease X C-terminal domain-containing protein [Mycobacteriaceae bacterium]